MTLLEQCQIWHEQNEFKKIIDALEALPEEERTPEIISELARAYNNVAAADERELFRRAIELLESVADYFVEDHNWNFRMAYAYYYLDEEGKARCYFNKALQARPDDADTIAFLNDCQERLALPRFQQNFRQRTQKAWAAFTAIEGRLREIMDMKQNQENQQELTTLSHQALSLAFADISFEIGFNGEKYELILTPEGYHDRLFELIYFQQNAPEALLQHWNILVGRQHSCGFELQSFGQSISGEDVQVWITQSSERAVNLELYCDKLLPFLLEDEDKTWWLLSALTDSILGEIPAMATIDGFDVLNAPRETPYILLENLPQKLAEMGISLSLDPKAYLDNQYVTYEMKPNDDPEADWRLDIFAGATQCPNLINDYLRNNDDLMDNFHQNGVVPGFFCYPLDVFANEQERGKAILDFRDDLEAAISSACGSEAVTFIGGASGIYCGYLDFIAWDLPTVLDAATDYFAQSPVSWANFHTFRRDVAAINLVDKTSEVEKHH